MSRSSFQEPENVTGAIVFVVYIITALLLTSLIIYDLNVAYASLFAPNRKNKSRPNPVGIGLLTALSTISFSVLSYHMLNVLILSYQTWADVHSLPLPTSIFSASVSSELHLWHWAKTSTLFRDFTSDITGSAARFWWTQAALSSSMAWSMWMAVKAARTEIPHLYRYWLLMQILPSSFGQTLFCLAVLLNREHKKRAEELWVPHAWVRVLTVVGYLVTVWNVAGSTGRKIDMYMVFLVRAWLFLPFITLKPREEEGLVWKKRRLVGDVIHGYSESFWLLFVGAFALQVRLTAELLNEGNSVKSLFSALDEKPAVSALGYDFLISVGSLIVWIWTEVERTP